MITEVSPKMKRLTVTNLEDSLRPLLWLNSVMGLSIFEIPSGNPWPKMSFLYALLRSAIYGYGLFNVVVYIPGKYYVTPIIFEVLKIILAFNVSSSVITTIFSLKYYKKVKGFLKKISLVDETLEVFGIDPEYESAHKEITQITLLWCFCGIFMFCSCTAVSYYVYENIFDSILLNFSMEFPLILNPIVEFNFVIKIRVIGKRFEKINALVQSIATSPLQAVNSKYFNKYQNILSKNQNKISVKSNYYLQNRNNIEFLLKSVRQLHLDLCITSREVNDTCSKQMSMQMASTFLILTGLSYCIYILYKDPKVQFFKKILNYIIFGMWIVVNVIKMIYVVRSSVNVATEAQKTSQLAHEIQLPRWQKKLIDEIHQLSLQIMQHPLFFTASGLIALDFNYVRGFVGSVTTYLMILIQNQPDVIKAVHTFADDSDDNSTTLTAKK